MNDLVHIAFGILLPLGPAYVLYKLLPSTANVSGPFKGLNIQLSGAFGGYFLLTLLVFGFLASRPRPQAEEMWVVTGRIDCQQSGNPVDINQLKLSILPPKHSHSTGSDGTFIVRVPAERLASGDADLPTLLIEHTGHEPVSINLNEEGFEYGQVEKKLRKDKENRKIFLGETFSLKRTTPYQPTGAPHQPAAHAVLEVNQ